MKKLMITALVAGVLLGACAPEIQAQSLKDILNSKTVQNAVTAVTGGQKMSMDNLVGTWTYSQPSVQLEGDNVLKDITGSVAATEAEKKLQEYCSNLKNIVSLPKKTPKLLTLIISTDIEKADFTS